MPDAPGPEDVAAHSPGGPPGRRAPAAPFTFGHELARKALHVSSAVVPLAYAGGVGRPWVVAGLGVLFAVAVVVEVARARNERARHHFTRYTGALLRAHEHDRWSGATWMLGAYLVAAISYPRPFAVAAMWAVGVGDASAAVIGRWWGDRRRRRAAPGAAVPEGKTYAGTLACFAAAFLGAHVVAGLPLPAAALAALLAALAERPRAPFDDNLRIVLAVGVAALAWQLTRTS